MKQSKKKDSIKFKKGDKVKTKYGQTRTVLYQEGEQVFVIEESNNWYHPSNLRVINNS